MLQDIVRPAYLKNLRSGICFPQAFKNFSAPVTRLKDVLDAQDWTEGARHRSAATPQQERRGPASGLPGCAMYNLFSWGTANSPPLKFAP